jgi:hypothetical protein
LQGDVAWVDGGNQLPLFYPLSLYNREADDLSADAEGKSHIFHGFHYSGEVFADNRL